MPISPGVAAAGSAEGAASPASAASSTAISAGKSNSRAGQPILSNSARVSRAAPAVVPNSQNPPWRGRQTRPAVAWATSSSRLAAISGHSAHPTTSPADPSVWHRRNASLSAAERRGAGAAWPAAGMACPPGATGLFAQIADWGWGGCCWLGCITVPISARHHARAKVKRCFLAGMVEADAAAARLPLAFFPLSCFYMSLR
jgi:hypothetical protein